MSKNFEKYVILKFSSRKQMKKFYESIEEVAADLVSVTDDYDKGKKKGKGKKRTQWSDWGMSNYDDKKAEKSGLPHPKSSKGVPGGD